MSEHDHNIIVEQDSSGGYICTVCGETSLLVLATGKWMHESENTASLLSDIVGRAEVKDFKPRGPQGYTDPNFIDVDTLYKNRRKALFCASHLDQDGYNDENDLLETAEKFERWLNRPHGEFWYAHDDDKDPTPLHVIEDEVQNLP